MLSKSNGVEKQDWDRLQTRYGGDGKKYRKRRIASAAIEDFEYFKEWLIEQGAEISGRYMPNEKLRFFLDGRIGIVYNTFSGSLIGHDMAQKFENEMKAGGV